MNETKFISDTHLGHANIVKYSRGTFASVQDMDRYIIRQWNEHTDTTDDVWILGDLSYRSAVSVSYYLGQMNGHKHLIVGNHDVKWMKSVDLAYYFESVDYMTVMKDQGRTLTLCHYPMLEWPQSRHQKYSLSKGKVWLIHGHIHNSRDTTFQLIRDHIPCALKAGFDINNYPVTFEELLENNHRWYGRKQDYH